MKICLTVHSKLVSSAAEVTPSLVSVASVASSLFSAFLCDSTEGELKAIEQFHIVAYAGYR